MFYTYPIATSFPGGVFTQAISDRLEALIQQNINDPLVGISSDGVNVSIEFVNPLSGPEQIVLDGGTTNPCGGLIAKSTEYFSVMIGAVQILGGAVFSLVSNGIFSAVVNLQYRDGNNNPINGQGDIVIDTDGIAPVTTLSGSFNGSGQFSFTVGPTTWKGNIPITIRSGSLPPVSFTIKFN